MKTAAEILLRQIASILSGDIAEQLLIELASKENRTLKPREADCFHEAGHAVVARLFAFPVAELRLLDHRRVTAICLPRPYDETIDLDNLWDDYHHAMSLVVSLREFGFLVCVPKVKRIVRRLLQKHWQQISALAEALLRSEKKYVDANEISAAVAVGVAAHCKGEGDYHRAAAALAAAAAPGAGIPSAGRTVEAPPGVK